MRFLLFNVVVLGALFYLFTADKADIHAASANAHAVVSKAEILADQAVDKVNSLIKAEPAAAEAAADEKQAEVAPEAITPPEPQKPVASAVAAPTPAPAIQPVVPEKAVAEEGRQAIPAPPAAPESKESGQVGPPRRLAVDEIPESWVPKRTNAKVDPAETQKLLANATPATPTAQTATSTASEVKETASGKGEIAIAKGETLMSPRERRKELAALAEDMELLSLKKLSR